MNFEWNNDMMMTVGGEREQMRTRNGWCANEQNGTWIFHEANDWCHRRLAHRGVLIFVFKGVKEWERKCPL